MRVEIMPCQCLIKGMRREIGLHHDFAAALAPPCASPDLLEKRKQPFGRAKFGAVERIVGPEDAD